MSTGHGPLEGLHILDLSSFVAGPSSTMTLAQLGADVLRVDPLGGPPDGRRHPLGPDGTSLYWAGLNKGKRVIQLDLRSKEGRDVVRELLGRGGASGGILVTNAVGQDWLSYERLAESRPDLIMVHLEGHSDGSSAIDYTINCETGLPSITGPVTLGVPANGVLPAWDLLAGLHSVIAVLTALRERAATGNGALIRVSLADVAATTMGHLGYIADAVLNGTERTREGNSLYGSYGQDFELADGRRLMLVALTARHWKGLVAVAGIGEAIAELEQSAGASLVEEGERYTHRAAITALLTPWFGSRTFAEATSALDGAFIPWGEYRTVRELATAPDGLVARSELFDTAEAGYPVPRSVARVAGWDSRPTAAPVHTDASTILTEWAVPPTPALPEEP